jgi:uncharacterized protein (DUF1800 family)
MGEKQLHRKDFLKKMIGAKTNEEVVTKEKTTVNDPSTDDPLFQKYARKTIGNRQYGTNLVQPDANGGIEQRYAPLSSNLDPYTGVWTEWEAAHLLKRAHYGNIKAHVDSFKAMGNVSTAVDALFNFPFTPTSPSAAPLNYYQNAYIDYNTPQNNNFYSNIDPYAAYATDWTATLISYYPYYAKENFLNVVRARSVKYWYWGLMLDETSAPTLREKMTQFWYHFIPVNVEKESNDFYYNRGTLANEYIKLLRNNCIGNYKTLIKEITKSAGMLGYLNGQSNTAAAPNENYAREVLELFTMGKVPTQNYTEQDVVALSKILTGYQCINANTNSAAGQQYPLEVIFNYTQHNQENKTFSSFFDNVTIAYQAGAAGANELDLFLDLLFTKQKTTIARYICTRLYRYFVYYDIDAAIETNIINPLADYFIASNWEIVPLVKKLFKSQHFYDAANRGVIIKSPFDLVAGLIRTLRIPTAANAVPPLPAIDPPHTPADYTMNQYRLWGYLDYNICIYDLEQGMFEVPSVVGWSAYHQAPTFNQNWINSNSVQNRHRFIENFINGWHVGYSWSGYANIKFDPFVFVQQFPSATIPVAVDLIDAIVKLLFSVDLPADYKTLVKNQDLLGNQGSDYYWTTIWNTYVSNPANITNKNIVQARIKAVITSLCQLAEFQLM